MIPRYGVPGGPWTWAWIINEDIVGECIVYADVITEIFGMGYPLPDPIWSIRCMGDNE